MWLTVGLRSAIFSTWGSLTWLWNHITHMGPHHTHLGLHNIAESQSAIPQCSIWLQSQNLQSLMSDVAWSAWRGNEWSPKSERSLSAISYRRCNLGVQHVNLPIADHFLRLGLGPVVLPVTAIFMSAVTLIKRQRYRSLTHYKCPAQNRLEIKRQKVLFPSRNSFLVVSPFSLMNEKHFSTQVFGAWPAAESQGLSTQAIDAFSFVHPS